MTRCRKVLALSAALVGCSLSGVALAQPDVIVGELPDFTNNAASGLYDSFAVGTTSCNKGSATLSWIQNNSLHPVIGQNLFRLYNGRLEQVSQAWLKHGFTALQGNACGFGCTANPNGSALGVGCSDPYSSGLNNGSGSSSLGPKWQVNPSTGQFPYPFTAGDGGPLRTRITDMDTTNTFPGARWFVEGQYVAQDDATAGKQNNNASWREVSITGTGNTMAGIGSTHREEPAIYAWKLVHPDVTIVTVDVPNDGRYLLGCRVTGTGPYTYEYALHNLTSNRCAGSFTVPLPGTQAALSGIGFHDVEAVGAPNAGNPADLAADDWAVSGGGASSTLVSWTGPAHTGNTPTWSGTSSVTLSHTLANIGGNDFSANVLRWGSMFNFRFTSEVAPASGNVSVSLWRAQAGGPASFLMTIPTPGGATVGVITGSCCTGTTCSVGTQTACTSGGGTFFAGGTCSPDPCATGSCCTAAGTCSVTTQPNCSATWTGGAICVPNPCPQPSGTCCVSGSCTFVTQANCSGVWTSGGSCSPNPCATGSCCTTAGGCTITTQANCAATWTAGASTCTPNPCPQPTGSCCISSVCSVTTQANCTGTWNTGGSCSPDPCSVTGGNDLCANAIALCANVPFNGTNIGATDDQATTNCSGNNTAHNDVWFSYTPAVTGTVTVSLCTAPASGAFDTVLVGYNGVCGALGTRVLCNDDSNSCPAGSLRSQGAFAGTAGVRYLLRVMGFNSATGNFVITVTGGNGTGCNTTGRCCIGTACTTTTQPNCSGTWAAGTCSPNPCNPTGSCCIGTACTSTTQSACTGTFTSGGTCGANTCDPLGSCCAAGNCLSTTASNCAAGGEAWTSGRSCTPNPCPPQTDNCADRAGVGPGTTTPFDTTNATTDGPTHALCLGSNDNNVAKDVWFNLPSTFDGTVTFDTCGSSFDTKIAVYRGYGCQDYETRLMACNDDFACGGTSGLQSSVTVNVVCGEYYTIRIGGYTNAQGVVAAGAGVLNITAVQAATGACCAANGICTSSYASCCTGGFTSGGSCTPNNCPQPTGACCDPNTGGCTVATHDNCGAAQSLYQGDNSSCTPNPCTQPMGACCALDGSCLSTAFGACSGSYMGNGTSCTPNPCTQPTGSCCVTDGSCSSTTSANCTGTWTSGASCTPNPCAQPMGSCCITGSCSVGTQANCTGTWTDGGSCTPNPCAQPTGACCCGSSCIITVSANCGGAGRVFVGTGSSCAPFSNTAPCCRGDYNHTGTPATVQDLFDFLAGYFNGDACANTNDSVDGQGAATLSVQDLFDYLAAYFGGC